MSFRTIVRNTLPAGILLAALATGCAPKYEDQRPPVDQLDRRDAGLQSKDVIQASDSLASDLLSLPQLNRSREQWTVVVDRVATLVSPPGPNRIDSTSMTTTRRRTATISWTRIGRPRKRLHRLPMSLHSVRCRR